MHVEKAEHEFLRGGQKKNIRFWQSGRRKKHGRKPEWKSQAFQDSCRTRPEAKGKGIERDEQEK